MKEKQKDNQYQDRNFTFLLLSLAIQGMIILYILFKSFFL